MEFTRELQKVLDLVVSLLLDGFARAAAPSIVVSDDDTASTDGKASVFMPRTFLGKPIAQQMANAIGLLAHEIGHWLQPLDEIKRIELETGLNHDIVNILLDIQLEANVVQIMPLFRGNLKGLRSDTGNVHRNDYDKKRKSDNFFESAFFTLLFCRFCVDPEFPFIAMPPDGRMSHKLLSMVQDASRFTSWKPKELPARLREIASTYPELCDKTQGRKSQRSLPGGTSLNPTDVVSSTGVGDLILLIEASLVVHDGTGDCRHWTAQLSRPVKPSAEVLAASRLIQRRWEVPRSAGAIMGPGRMNRLAAVRGDPVPFEVQAPRGRSSPKTKVVLVADYSTSMSGMPWVETIKAAQAISLAIQNTGGEVKGALFEAYLIHQKDFSADIFFSRSIGDKSLMDAHGRDTSFGWLPLVWQMFPEHRIVLLTDGNGRHPPIIPQTARKRTSAILLRITDSKARAHAEHVVRKFADRFVHVNNLNEIASAWSVVIPRLA